MSKRKTENLEKALIQKKTNHSIRVSTFIHGSCKNFFLEDCILREKSESNISGSVLKLFYNITTSNPSLKGKEFSEIQNIINESLNGVR